MMRTIMNSLYPLMLLAGATVYCFGLKRRNHFLLRVLVTIPLFFAYFLSMRSEILNSPVGGVFSYTTYLVDWVILFCGIFVLFDIRLTTVAFAATCAYCLQHITQRINFLFVNIVFDISDQQLLRILLYAFIGAVVTAVFAALYRKENPNIFEEPLVDDVRQFAITIISLFISLGVEAYTGGDLFRSNSQSLMIGNFLISILFACLIIQMEYNTVFRRRATDENTVLKQMLIKEREQYKIEQNIIEAINIQVHDMRNRLSSAHELLDLEEAEEIKESISIYDSIYKTGNKALDTVLTMKGLVCKSKGIELTCIADGGRLSFMRESEAYSLFENLLNNCIEAVENLPPEQRIISLSVVNRGAGLCINTENYYAGGRTLSSGLPETTKQNKLHHGYGLKSVRKIVQKYKGELQISAESNIFSVSILFL